MSVYVIYVGVWPVRGHAACARPCGLRPCVRGHVAVTANRGGLYNRGGPRPNAAMYQYPNK